MISRVNLPVLAAACVFASGAVATDTVTILAKPGVDFAGRITDLSHCGEAAHLAPLSDLPPPDRPPTVPVVYNAGIGGVLGSAIAAQAEVDRAIAESRKNAKLLCMHYLGYVDLPLTPEEAQARRHGDEDEWDKAFLASDLSVRLKVLTTPKVPPLPPYRDEPWMQGGLKIEADTLAIVPGEVTDSGNLAVGKVLRLRTATLTAPLQMTDGDIRIAADAGAVFHQADFRVQYIHMLRNESAVWCGPVREQTAGNETKTVYCLQAALDGYDVFRPEGEAWLAGSYKDGPRLSRYAQPIALAERANDDLGPLDLTISAAKVNKAVVQLVATVRHDGKQVQIWNRDLVFDSRGNAYLPLWSKRLIVAHTSRYGVTATLDDKGDGHGWKDGD